ncbi:MFS transporter [Catellatospora citrea]|uniref:MFS transporter n=1 Tax=Catellatospora citrea TaxID=53366 RepID=A0A8J3KR95_9ACTN|nr:MFS transporter [Catellatospora citrea]RKE11827.1 putative MFS family arabinose efflux permease [Catellatospora citrea]GIF99879.1 MFS transporter [Catellatospora citrea]
MSTFRDSLAPLRHAPFRHLVTGRVVSLLGNAVAPIALAFAVLDLTRSPIALGLVVGARSLTNVLFVLFGGVLADRLPRHLVMVGSSVLAALTQAAVAALVLTGTATVPLLIGLSAVNGVVSAIAMPATAALLPQTVPADQLTPANALNRLGGNTAMIAGAALGGVLVAAVGPGWGLAVDAATFGLGAVAFTLVRVPEVRDRTAPRQSTLHELRVGWTEFVSRSWVWTVVLAVMFINAAHSGAMGVLGPTVADRTIERSGWGVVLAVETAGMVAGAVLALRLRVRRPLLVGCVSLIGFVLPMVALAESPTLPVLMVCGFLAGVAVEQFAIAWDSSLQRHVPADRLARVYSYDMLGSFLAIPVGQVLAGPLDTWIGTENALLCAAAVMALGVVGMLANHGVRHLRADTPATTPEPAAIAA